MTKIKFNCPSCQAKLKVPVELAGIAGPCPQCGGTIVAPLQPQVNQNALQPEPAMASAGAVSNVNVAPPLQQQPPIVTPPPTTVEQPLQPAVHATAPPQVTPQQVTPEPLPLVQQQLPAQEPVTPFPMPLEQVSQTAAVALSQNPAQVPQPGPVMPAPGPGVSGNLPLPEAPPESLLDQSNQAEIPHAEDIFDQQVGLSHPETQPIIVKKKSVEELPPVEAESVEKLPQLDAGLADAGADVLSSEALYQSDSYRPPNPVALTPPEGLVGVDVEDLPFEEELEVEAEFPLNEQSEEFVELYEEGTETIEELEEIPEAQDSMAALLGEASEPVVEEKSKDEILNELLGVAPARVAKKKKGLSFSSIAMLTVLVLVFVAAIAGVVVYGVKFGGFSSLEPKDALGEQGIENLKKREENFNNKEVSDEVAAVEQPANDLFSEFDGIEGERQQLLKENQAVAPEPKPIVQPPATPQTRSYDPAEFYPLPGPEDTALTNTHELIDAFLRAPDWQTQSKYSYRSASIQPTMSKYYQANEFVAYHKYLPTLMQMELNPEFGGPFWVFEISESNEENGTPLLVRPEGGNLKVDWELFSEFKNQDFVNYRANNSTGTQRFRLVIEPMAQYPGPDAPGFKDLNQFDCYKIYPPYGAEGENTEYTFVLKNSAIANQLKTKFTDEIPGLAASLTLERKSFSHGIKHLVLKDFSEGWLE